MIQNICRCCPADFVCYTSKIEGGAFDCRRYFGEQQGGGVISVVDFLDDHYCLRLRQSWRGGGHSCFVRMVCWERKERATLGRVRRLVHIQADCPHIVFHYLHKTLHFGRLDVAHVGNSECVDVAEFTRINCEAFGASNVVE